MKQIVLAACLAGVASGSYALHAAAQRKTPDVRLKSDSTSKPADPKPAWNIRAAANYLDGRMEWWGRWQNAQRDHDTACVSCHTSAPYALAGPALHKALGDSAATAGAQKMYADVAKRVSIWREVDPAYSDQRNGLPKSSESRGTESILNALVLASRDSHAGTMTDETRQAFKHMFALQMRTGDLKGAWPWLNFHYEPWESNDGAYYGAAVAALALGLAPGGYAASPDIQEAIGLLRDHLQRRVDQETLFNRAMALWASGRIPGLLTTVQRDAIVNAAGDTQLPDGGWSMARLGSWKRQDGTPVAAGSDGYATGLMVLALRQAGMSRADAFATHGAEWLIKNQDAATGVWTLASLNKQRDPASDVGKFMSDAATAYASLALATR